MVSPTLTRPPTSAPWNTSHTAAPAVVPARAARGWNLRRVNIAVSAVAAVTALWLGLTAPSVSPVTPAVPPVATVAGTTTTGDVVTGPVVPSVVTVPRDGRRR